MGLKNQHKWKIGIKTFLGLGLELLGISSIMLISLVLIFFAELFESSSLLQYAEVLRILGTLILTPVSIYLGSKLQSVFTKKQKIIEYREEGVSPHLQFLDKVDSLITQADKLFDDRYSQAEHVNRFHNVELELKKIRNINLGFYCIVDDTYRDSLESSFNSICSVCNEETISIDWLNRTKESVENAYKILNHYIFNS